MFNPDTIHISPLAHDVNRNLTSLGPLTGLLSLSPNYRKGFVFFPACHNHNYHRSWWDVLCLSLLFLLEISVNLLCSLQVAFFSRKLISVFTEEKILCCLHARYLLVLPQLAALSFSSSFLSLASCYPQGIIRYKNQTKQRSFSSFFNRFLAQECQHAVSCFILKISGTLFFFLWIPKKDF